MGAVLEPPALPLRQMGRICSAVQLVAPKRLPDFHFFNCPGFRIFILCEIHCYLCPHIFWVYHFSLSQCVQQYSSPCIITPLILNYLLLSDQKRRSNLILQGLQQALQKHPMLPEYQQQKLKIAPFQMAHPLPKNQPKN